LPFSVKNRWLLVIAFLLGISMDYFTVTPGLHASACVLIAYIRPFLINILTPRDSSEFNYREPSPQSMQMAPYAVYIVVLTFIHHGFLLFLEWLSVGAFWEFLVNVLSSTAVSLLLIFTVELLFPRKMKYRTNTAG
jgi:hypothetical protein